jgi:hypothetical protein
LRAHISSFDNASYAEHPISKSRLTMVDMSNDAEISNLRGVSLGWLWCFV